MSRCLLLIPVSFAVACGDGGSDQDTRVAAVEIATCGEITASGRYRLVADVPADPRSEPCLVIHDTSDVTLDCSDHTLSGEPALDVQRVQRFRIEHCRFERPPGPFDSHAPTPGVVRIRNGENGIIATSRIGVPGLLVLDTHHAEVTRNAIDSYVQFDSSHMRIAENVLRNPVTTESTVAVVQSGNGSFNRFVDNTLDGGWNGVRSRLDEDRIGADDGFLFYDEHNAEVSGNVIRNVWDCGIETLGLSSDTSMERNTIENASACGIGGWYWNSIRDNTYADNTVRGSCALFYFYRVHGLRPAEGSRAADDFVYIANNRFVRNRIERYADCVEDYAAQVLFDYGQLTNNGPLPGERAPRPEDFVFANNLFRDNDFGTSLPVFFGRHDQGFVVDGGGNRCRQPDAADYPLRCE